MKAESNIMPQQPFAVDNRGDVSDVTFFKNPVEVQREAGTAWEYEIYTLTTIARPALDALIEENYDAWLNAAIAFEAAEHPQARTIEEKVEVNSSRIATIEQTIDVLYGGI